MREHEVPTHVQAEDRVLLGFTFPQVVAVTAVCAISYGAYRYAPVGPSEVRMAIAVLLGLVGVAMTVGKIGGRRLPLVAADLLKYRLGARRYAGPVSQLVRAEPPAPPHPVKSGPGPLSLMAKRAGRGLGRLRKNRKTTVWQIGTVPSTADSPDAVWHIRSRLCRNGLRRPTCSLSSAVVSLRSAAVGHE